MTLQQFLKRLTLLNDGKWAYNGAMALRHPSRSARWCPLTFAARDLHPNERFMLSEYDKAGKALGMKVDLVMKIVYAADASASGYDKSLRAKLLKACGLNEKSPVLPPA